ncbi:MAG TPA: hypothetical protein IAB47_04855 [Candidatus Scatomorpha merdigallinarum]|nr:hypothetical protein [Candidatus Scatomorpha merdigallinarum]
MPIRIKQGDAYSVPIVIKFNGSSLDVDDVEEVEFTIGDTLRKLWPGDVEYSTADGTFNLPLTQSETFAFPANSSVTLDIRVKFISGVVIGVQRMESFAVADAVSEVTL